jgi:insertion element IS1 protein InsB
VNPYLLDKVEAGQLAELEVEVCYDTEWDEFWSFAGSKANQRWTWYLVERGSGVVLAFHQGRRTDQSLRALLAKVAHLPLRACHTDDWGAYQRLLPQEYLHRVGKQSTWKIERRNLNFRTHLKRLHRKTICFSRSEQVHDNVIGMYINRYYFKNGIFADSVKT